LALAFLLGVFLLVIVLIALFVFPPSRWAETVTKEKEKKK
jgi:poly-D-alanine transfer protein DltD